MRRVCLVTVGRREWAPGAQDQESARWREVLLVSVPTPLRRMLGHFGCVAHRGGHTRYPVPGRHQKDLGRCVDVTRLLHAFRSLCLMDCTTFWMCHRP